MFGKSAFGSTGGFGQQQQTNSVFGQQPQQQTSAFGGGGGIIEYEPFYCILDELIRLSLFFIHQALVLPLRLVHSVLNLPKQLALSVNLLNSQPLVLLLLQVACYTDPVNCIANT